MMNRSHNNKSRFRRLAAAALCPTAAIAKKLMSGDAKSYFYGDPVVDIQPEDASSAIVGEVPETEVAESAVVNTTDSDVDAAARLAAYKTLSPSEKAQVTLLPVLSTWNAQVKMNPLLGKILAKALDYNLTKTLNEYPTAGKIVFAEVAGRVGTITITPEGSTSDPGDAVAVPFVVITIAASSLTARAGASLSINFSGTDAQGNEVSSSAEQGEFTFFRLASTEAVVLVYVPFRKVATRTLPFLPVAKWVGAGESQNVTITITGVAEDEQIACTVPGYATKELAQVAKMYNLPSGDIK